MFLVVNCDGKFWDGLGWNVQGKVFCSVGSAQRSLHEHGEELDSVAMLPVDLNAKQNYDSPSQFSTRSAKTC